MPQNKAFAPLLAKSFLMVPKIWPRMYGVEDLIIAKKAKKANKTNKQTTSFNP